MPMGGLMAGAVVAPVVSSYLGNQQAQASRDAAAAAQQQALAQYLGISAPSVADQALNLQQYQSAGAYNPQLEAALQLGPTAMQGIQTDPRLMQAQMAALQQLSQTGQMGMTPAEAAALSGAQQTAAAQAQAKSQQIQDEFARRGMGGSGAELAARLQGSQGAAQMLAQNSNQIAQQAQQAALQATAQAGLLGGQMQGQQFGQQAEIARAKDYINQFNLQNAQNIQGANVQSANQAALGNLLRQQNLLNQNTQLTNQQQQYNKQLQQQLFNNQMALASGRAGQYQGITQTNMQNAANTANQYAGIGQGVGQGLAAAAQYYGQQNSPYNQYWQNALNQQQSAQGFSPQEQNTWLNSGGQQPQQNQTQMMPADNYGDYMGT